MKSKTESRHTIGTGKWCGTPGGYSNHRCRCDDCKEAWRVARKDYMERNPQQREAQRARTRQRRIDRMASA